MGLIRICVVCLLMFVLFMLICLCFNFAFAYYIVMVVLCWNTDYYAVFFGLCLFVLLVVWWFGFARDCIVRLYMMLHLVCFGCCFLVCLDDWIAFESVWFGLIIDVHGLLGCAVDFSGYEWGT